MLKGRSSMTKRRRHSPTVRQWPLMQLTHKRPRSKFSLTCAPLHQEGAMRSVDAKANVYLANNVTDDVKRIRNVTVTKRRVASLPNCSRATRERLHTAAVAPPWNYGCCRSPDRAILIET